jgi:hypothetical protein
VAFGGSLTSTISVAAAAAAAASVLVDEAFAETVPLFSTVAGATLSSLSSNSQAPYTTSCARKKKINIQYCRQYVINRLVKPKRGSPLGR